MRLSIKLSLFLFFAGISLISFVGTMMFVFVSDKKISDNTNFNAEKLASIFLGKVVTNGQYICQVKNDSLIFKTQKDIKNVKNFLESLGVLKFDTSEDVPSLFYGETSVESQKDKIEEMLSLSDFALYVRNEKIDSFVKTFSTNKFFDDKIFTVKNSLGSISSASEESELFDILENEICQKIVVIDNELFFRQYIPIVDADGKVVASFAFYFLDKAYNEFIEFFESKKIAQESLLWVINLNDRDPQAHVQMDDETFNSILRTAEKLGAGEWEKITFSLGKTDYICAFAYHKDWNIIVGAMSGLKYLVGQENIQKSVLRIEYLIATFFFLIFVFFAYMFACMFGQSFKILFNGVENTIVHKESFVPLADKFFISEFATLASSINVMNKNLSALLRQANLAKDNLLQSEKKSENNLEKIKGAILVQSKVLTSTKFANNQVNSNLSDSKNICSELESESIVSLKIAKKDFANLTSLKKDSVNFKDDVGEFVSKILALKATAEDLHSKISVIADYSMKSKDFASLTNLEEGKEKSMMKDLENLYSNTADTLKNSESLLSQIKILLDENIQDLNLGALNMGKNISHKEKSLNEINSLFLRLELLSNKFQELGRSFSLYENNLLQISKVARKISRETLDANSSIDDLQSLSQIQKTLL